MLLQIADEPKLPLIPDLPELPEARPGKPRTILLLGSDARYADTKAGVRPRSDTILLVRIDPRPR